MLNIDYPAKHLETGLFPYKPPFIAVIDNFLNDQECAQLVKRIEALAPAPSPINMGGGREAMRPDVRNNDRVMFDDVTLAAALFDRMRFAIPKRAELAVSLNERFRGYRYTRGQRFRPHFDGAYVRDAKERSQITVLLYLNESFTGGETKFNDLELAIVPRTGLALLFDHAVLHEGCEVLGGAKYVLRTDVMYRE
jgi:prolyl 4-hydroxylase